MLDKVAPGRLRASSLRSDKLSGKSESTGAKAKARESMRRHSSTWASAATLCEPMLLLPLLLLLLLLDCAERKARARQSAQSVGRPRAALEAETRAPRPTKRPTQIGPPCAKARALLFRPTARRRAAITLFAASGR